jgi:hypothetical protein
MAAEWAETGGEHASQRRGYTGGQNGLGTAHATPETARLGGGGFY